MIKMKETRGETSIPSGSICILTQSCTHTADGRKYLLLELLGLLLRCLPTPRITITCGCIFSIGLWLLLITSPTCSVSSTLSINLLLMLITTPPSSCSTISLPSTTSCRCRRSIISTRTIISSIAWLRRCLRVWLRRGWSWLSCCMWPI